MPVIETREVDTGLEQDLPDVVAATTAADTLYELPNLLKGNAAAVGLVYISCQVVNASAASITIISNAGDSTTVSPGQVVDADFHPGVTWLAVSGASGWTLGEVRLKPRVRYPRRG